MPIIDISPALHEKTPVWPGDTPLSRKWLAQLKISGSNPAGSNPEGSSVVDSNINLSTLTTTVHIGAHADAPSHYLQGAPTIDQVDLEPYLGPCLVIDAQGCEQILPLHCEEALKTGARRLLFKTRCHRESDVFEKQFASFSPDAVEVMGKSGILLAGIDTNSVDPFESKDLPAHKMFGRYNIRNLEGLDLLDVEPGTYELIALPLKLQGFDASPVRAILRKIPK